MAQAAILSTNESTSVRTSSGSVSNSFLLVSLSEVFCSLANLRTSEVLNVQKQRIQEHIADIGRLLGGEDNSSENYYEV